MGRIRTWWQRRRAEARARDAVSPAAYTAVTAEEDLREAIVALGSSVAELHDVRGRPVELCGAEVEIALDPQGRYVAHVRWRTPDVEVVELPKHLVGWRDGVRDVYAQGSTVAIRNRRSLAGATRGAGVAEARPIRDRRDAVPIEELFCTSTSDGDTATFTLSASRPGGGRFTLVPTPLTPTRVRSTPSAPQRPAAADRQRGPPQWRASCPVGGHVTPATVAPTPLEGTTERSTDVHRPHR